MAFCYRIFQLYVCVYECVYVVIKENQPNSPKAHDTVDFVSLCWGHKVSHIYSCRTLGSFVESLGIEQFSYSWPGPRAFGYPTICKENLPETWVKVLPAPVERVFL